MPATRAVLVNPQTKNPTGFEPNEGTPRFFDITGVLMSERERSLKIVSDEIARWNVGGEFYANVTEACDRIAARIRSGE